jgi:hypothetical protein
MRTNFWPLSSTGKAMKSQHILNQALLIDEGVTFSRVEKLIDLSREYQESNQEIILDARAREAVRIVNQEGFFDFVSEYSGVRVESFDDIRAYMQTDTKKENIAFSSDSKSKNIHPFNQTVLIRQRGKLPMLYQSGDLKSLKVAHLVAIENSESFLNLDESRFEGDYFVYLGGNANRLTRAFLLDKNVAFFVDYDIVSMNFYDQIAVKSKTLYIPNDLEELFVKYGNQSLYQKQRKLLKSDYSDEAMQVISLVMQYKKVLEQEIV